MPAFGRSFRVDGVFAVYKPKGFTSFDVIAKLRGILKQRRLGHSGTLDPMATGVLAVFAGHATKAVDLVPDELKVYSARVRLGIKTDTGDITGTVVEKSGARPSGDELRRAAAAFVGVSEQTPPMYSAVKVGGVRLYAAARAGLEVERPARRIEIYDVGISEVSDEGFRMDVRCKKGVYIRTLAEDIAAACGALATLEELRRDYSSGFSLSDCHTLDEIALAAEKGEAEKLMLPVDAVFKAYPALTLGERDGKRFLNGMTLGPEAAMGESGPVRVYRNGAFLGLGRADGGGLKKTVQFYWD